MRPLREHQAHAVSLLRSSFLAGRTRPLIQAPTGAGKTLLAAYLIDRALQQGKRITFTVPALSLVDQTVQAFWAEGIREIGVMQADHSMTDGSRRVQVASVQTLGRRRFPETDLVIVDEAHQQFAVLQRWMAEAPEVKFIGLSATPWARGMAKHFDDLLVCSTTADLIRLGYLSPFKVYAPSKPDLSAARTVAGDWREDDLSAAMTPLTADVVSTWLQRGEGRPTLCFAVDRQHAKGLQTQFEAAGICTGYVDAYTSKDDREVVRKAFAAGELQVVCNVGVLTTGVDWDVRCIILARPTQSEMLYVQIIGRGLRTAEGKADCLILDHSDTTMRLGFVTDIHHDKLDDGKPREKAERKEKAQPKARTCGTCAFVLAKSHTACPACGAAAVWKGQAVETEEGELVEFDAARRAKPGQAIDWAERTGFVAQLEKHARDTNKKPGWVANSYRDRYGVWPSGPARSVAPSAQVSPAVASWIKAKAIRFAKRRSAA